MDSYSAHIPLHVVKPNGLREPFDPKKIRIILELLASDLLAKINVEIVLQELLRTIYDGITLAELKKALVLSAITFLEKDPLYGTLASRLLLQCMYAEIGGVDTLLTPDQVAALYRRAFIDSIKQGVHHNILQAKLLEFDLEALASHIVPERDHLLEYLGLQTLYDRYFIKLNGKQRIELPQTFWMRIAMGLALNEADRTARAVEFYNIISTLRYMPSTPTLFHAGFVTAQLSSCYLTTIPDDLEGIFKCMGDNAQLSKWAGGIGNDWTSIRGTGSLIKSIKAQSQGVVPFLKIANDVVAGITRGGIRRGGVCAYMEVWHFDIEDFLDLRRNTGDERRRTHDMNTANWIPDLFMKRVQADAHWTLFSPDEVPDLHELYGAAFEKRYQEYEALAQQGKMIIFKVIEAKKLWRKMLSRLFETGHPWITFKDPCNIRSPQDHVGVVHSSNLCTEITLNTSADETAVCNLGSVNLARHIVNGAIDDAALEATITTAIRMLDNVIDLNFYPTKEAYNSNIRHRPIGLGCMGFQDALYQTNIFFDSEEAIEFADIVGEKISYYAIKGSALLAQERGTYSSYIGSKWDRGIFPLDTLDVLEQERGMPIKVSRTTRLDWSALKLFVQAHGMRNSNVLAVAPTATISNITGCYPCIEPIYRNIYVKANVSGEFTVVNVYLVNDLKALGLWNNTMLDQLKYYDGSLEHIADIPDDIKRKYKTAFEIDPVHLVKITAARGKWIDQSQSHNVFMVGVSGQMLHDIYMTGWEYGLKTFYYLRTLGASQIEKSTLDAKKYGFTQKREYTKMAATAGQEEPAAPSYKGATLYACDITNEGECESCQ